MRLTLRTLLAYLDDTLEPNQAKEIGQKVSESDTAQELITRIKQVTRRRRLTTPPDAGPGAKLDPNTIAGYLDNALDADQLAEVEQTCLASDVHLAEVATCHQILTLVLGEPALVPPTAKQRMYALVKGREAIPFRKPPSAAGEPEEPPEGKEVDETLRLGLPALRRKGGWSNWAVIGGGATALVACLVVAIIMLLRSGGGDEADGPGPKKGPHVQASTDKKPGPDKGGKNGSGSTDKDKGEQKDKGDGQPPKQDDGKKGDGGKEDKEGKKGPQPGANGEPSPGPPSDKVEKIGQFEPPAPNDPPALLMQAPKDGAWQRLKRPNPLSVWSGKPLVSLPASRSKVLTNRGVRLTLWGTVPEFFPGPLPLYESLVVPHSSERFDLDLTLRRGRIALANTKDKPLKVRVRFENSTGPNPDEMWDIVLEQQGAEVLLDRAGAFDPEEPFFPNPKAPNRAGPVSQVGLLVLKGSVGVRVGDVAHDLSAPGGPTASLLYWNSRRGPFNPIPLKELPSFTQARPTPPKGSPKELETQRAALESAVKQLNADLLERAPDLGLIHAMKSTKPAELKLAVRCYGALDMLDKLIDALADKQRQEVRLAAIETLQHWCASSRDNEYRLLDELKSRYESVEAENIVALLHRFPQKALTRPETYDALITQLTTAKLSLPIRELAAWHLIRMLPEAQKEIQAALTLSSPEMLEQIHMRLRQILPKGKLPSRFEKGAAEGK